MAIDQEQLIINFTGDVASGSMVSISFESLIGANPKEMGYFVAIWQGGQIQSIDRALDVQDIKTSSKDGDATFKNLSISSLEYTIGFGINRDNGEQSICATLSVPTTAKIGDPLDNGLSSLKVTKTMADSLIARYETPEYNTPATNNNWIALFKGKFTANMYTGKNVIVHNMVEEDTSSGGIAMNDIPRGLERFQTYTLIYGMGLGSDNKPDFSNLVAATEFDIQ